MGQEIWYRGEAVGVAPATPGSTPPHDIGDGMYLSDRAEIAVKYAELRTTDPNARRVYSVPIDPSSLRVLDLTKDPRWQKLMKSPQPGLPGGEDLIKQANENYGRYFQAFIKSEKIDLSKYDAVIGQEYVRGGKQLCILFRGGKPSPLQVKIRGLFRAVALRTGAVPSAVPGGSAAPGGRIGPGLKIVGGMIAMVGLQILVNYIWAKILGKMLEDEMKKLEPVIKSEVAKHNAEVAEIQVDGRKPFANVSIIITEGNMRSEGSEFPLPPKVKLDHLSVSDQDLKNEGPATIETFFGGSLTHHPVTYSFEVALSQDEIDLYRAFKLEMLWYDEQIRNPNLVPEDAVRLSEDRSKLQQRFSQALGQ